MRILIFLVLGNILLFSQPVRSSLSDTIGSNTAEIEFADSLYNHAVSNLTFLDFDDCTNCPLRAHVITFLLTKHFPELKIGKVWLFADSKLSSRKDYYRTHAREYLNLKNMCELWSFHVAPILIFGKDTIVIDPSTQSSPVRLESWIKTIADKSSSFLVIKEAKYYSFPDIDDDNLFDDNLDDWGMNYEFSSLAAEIDFLAQRLTIAYNNMFDPLRFRNYKNILSKLITTE